MPEGNNEAGESNSAKTRSHDRGSSGPRTPIPPQEPPTGTAQVQHCDPDPNSASAVRGELHWLERLNIFGQLSLVVVGIIAASIYGCQLSVMRGQLNQMNQQLPELRTSSDAAARAATAAETSNSNAERFFEVGERAYLGDRGLAVMQSPSRDRQAIVKVSILNGGHTPALNVSSREHFVVSNKELNKFIEPENKGGSKSTLLPSADMWTNPVATDSSIDSKGHINAATFDALQHRRYFLYLFGVIAYDDVFGKRWESRFCYFYVPDQATNEGIFGNCKFGNTIGQTARH